jgi:hypothetical protein
MAKDENNEAKILLSEKEIEFYPIGHSNAPIIIGNLDDSEIKEIISGNWPFRLDNIQILDDDSKNIKKLNMYNEKGLGEGASGEKIIYYIDNNNRVYIKVIERPGNRDLNYDIESISDAIVSSVNK